MIAIGTIGAVEEGSDLAGPRGGRALGGFVLIRATAGEILHQLRGRVVDQIEESLLHVAARVKQPGHDGPLGAAHGLRHVFIRQTLQLAHHQHAAMVV
jgi:hypothetical protein